MTVLIAVLIIFRVRFNSKVNELKVEQQNLKESYSYWQTICENTPGYLLTLDSDLKILYINRTVESLDKNSIIGMYILDLAPEDTRDDVEYKLTKVLNEGGSICYESYYVAPNGKKYYFLVNAVAFDYEAMGAKIMVISHDITDLKEKEVELLEAKKRAEQANETKSAILANMSHELKTPIHGILGMAEVLKSSELNEENIEQVKSINRFGNSLISLVDDILDLASLEAGKLKIREHDFILQELLKDIYHIFEISAKNKKIDLKIETNLDLGNRILKGDIVRIKQILVNLVGNAIKFTQQGQVKVQTIPQFNQTFCELSLIVEDTGVGISKEFHDKVFHAFEQIDSGNSRGFGGTGLGLAIVKNLTDLMKGELSLESDLGKGAVFTVTLPLKYSEYH